MTATDASGDGTTSGEGAAADGAPGLADADAAAAPDAEPDDALPDDRVPDDAVPDDALPDDAVPDDAAFDDARPDDAVRSRWDRYGWIGVLVAVALVVALVGFTVVGRLSARNAAEGDTGAGAPVAVTVEQIRALPGEVGHAVYWAGERPDTTYELTRTDDGAVYLRYLTGGAEVGTPDASHVVVATYSQPDAFATMKAAAAKPWATSTTTTSGALVVTPADSPTSTYFAFPGAPLVVEVYAPTAGESRRLVESGTVAPVS